MANIGARKDGDFKAVSTAPSINKTPVGPGFVPLPYPTVSALSDSIGVAKSVRFNGKPVYTLDSSQQCCKGDEQGSGGGIRSGTVNGEVRPTGASTTVRVEGKRVVRHGDPCTMNGGNNPGIYVTVPPVSSVPPAAAAGTSNPPVTLQTQEEESAFHRWVAERWSEVQQARLHPIEGLKGAVKGIANIPSNSAELLLKGAVELHATEMANTATTVASFGQGGGARSLLELAAANREQAAKIEVPKLSMSNPSQVGGDLIATVVQFLIGGVGVVRAGPKVVARMGRNSAAESVAAGTKIVSKVVLETKEDLQLNAPTKISNDGLTISQARTSENLIRQRVFENEKLRNSPGFLKDREKARVSEEQVNNMFSKKFPLSFKNEEQFEEFRAELGTTLNQAGLSDAKVGLKGTSTTFYSENPGKPLGHFWDADLKNPGDYDINIDSQKMVKIFEEKNIEVSEKYGIFKTRDINNLFPDIGDFSQKWREILGRDVNFIGLKDSPVRDSTEYILKEKND